MDRTKMSAVKPKQYAERYMNFVKRNLVGFDPDKVSIGRELTSKRLSAYGFGGVPGTEPIPIAKHNSVPARQFSYASNLY
jgi:hypothetical protein